LGHLVSVDNLTDSDLEDLFRRADVFHRSRQQAPDRLDRRILAVLFYEPSTRTRLSFESAILRLGGQVLGFSDAGSSSVAKGETVADTIRMVAAYADAVVMRHPAAGSTQVAAEYTELPLVSGGDGAHLHPTQTLTDLYYLRQTKGAIEDLTVAVAGDLHAGRTVHSLATALARLGARIVCVAPQGLTMPDYVVDEVQERFGGHIDSVDRLEDCLDEADVIYMTRLQRERLPESLRHVEIPRVDAEMLSKMRPDTIILHPLPRVDEIAYEVDEDLRAGYFEQAAGGVTVRMALLDLMLADETFATGQRPFKPVTPKESYARCDNPGCITHRETYVPHRPVVTDWSPDQPRCGWCEHPLVQGVLDLERD
jgi:aspartate carbamoyltransferase catalytic subunit